MDTAPIEHFSNVYHLNRRIEVCVCERVADKASLRVVEGPDLREDVHEDRKRAERCRAYRA